MCVTMLGRFAILNVLDNCQYFFAKVVQYLANFHLVLCKSFNRLDQYNDHPDLLVCFIWALNKRFLFQKETCVKGCKLLM